MPSLAELTDAYPQQQDNSLPVEQPYLGVPADPDGIRRVYINGDTAIAPSVAQPITDARPEPRPEPGFWDNVGMAGVKDKSNALTDLKDKISRTYENLKFGAKSISDFDQKFGNDVAKLANIKSSDVNTVLNKLFGEDRYQLWPEKVASDALTSAGDVMTPNPYQEGTEEHLAYEDLRQKSMVPAALNISALAGTGGLAGVGEGSGAALGSSPMLRPALKYEGKIYKAPVNGQHLDALPAHLADDFQTKAMSGEDISHYQFGFMNHKGQFLDREKALDYAIKEGLIDQSAGQYGALTSTLLADSSKPGTAIEAMAKTGQPFYSTLERNVNQIQQSKMTGDQWLGTLSNKPGVKPEELQWTGVNDFLKERGNQPVTKQELQEHLNNNKVELKEVDKGEYRPEQLKEKEYYESLDKHSKKMFNQDYDHLSSNDQSHVRKAAFEDQHINPTKYHSYQLPGGENYREKLLTLPDPSKQYNEFIKGIRTKYGEGGINNLPLTEAERAMYEKLLAKAEKVEDGVNYKSSHWDEPNILAHIRMNDRNMPITKEDTLNWKAELSGNKDGKDFYKIYDENGKQVSQTFAKDKSEAVDKAFQANLGKTKKSLHLEEIQSDWHQQGREKGYIQKYKPEDLKMASTAEMTDPQRFWYVKTPDNVFQINKTKAPTFEDAKNYILNEKSTNSGGVPDAPFKKSWHELALKRMLHEAATKGYDRLSWTPGEAQALRYPNEMRKAANSIDWHTKTMGKIDPSGEKQVLISMKDGSEMELKINKEGIITQGRSEAKGKNLSEIIGKEMANDIINKNEGNIAGKDFVVGGEGMKGFYDQIIPKALEKISGEKVKSGKIQGNTNIKGGDALNVSPKDLYTNLPELREKYPKLSDFVDYYNDLNTNQRDVLVNKARGQGTQPIHYIDIPQSLKDKAMKGFPLFSGNYQFVPVLGNPFEEQR